MDLYRVASRGFRGPPTPGCPGVGWSGPSWEGSRERKEIRRKRRGTQWKDFDRRGFGTERETKVPLSLILETEGCHPKSRRLDNCDPDPLRQPPTGHVMSWDWRGVGLRSSSGVINPADFTEACNRLRRTPVLVTPSLCDGIFLVCEFPVRQCTSSVLRVPHNP